MVPVREIPPEWRELIYYVAMAVALGLSAVKVITGDEASDFIQGVGLALFGGVNALAARHTPKREPW